MILKRETHEIEKLHYLKNESDESYRAPALIKYLMCILDASSCSGDKLKTESQYATDVFNDSMVGVLPNVPLSPAVHSFILCDVVLEPSYRGILYAWDGKYDGTAKSVGKIDLLAELAIIKLKLWRSFCK